MLIGFYEDNSIRIHKLIGDLLSESNKGQLIKQIHLESSFQNFHYVEKKHLFLMYDKNFHLFIYANPYNNMKIILEEVKYPKINTTYRDRC